MATMQVFACADARCAPHIPGRPSDLVFSGAITTSRVHGADPTLAPLLCRDTEVIKLEASASFPTSEDTFTPCAEFEADDTGAQMHDELSISASFIPTPPQLPMQDASASRCAWVLRTLFFSHYDFWTSTVNEAG